MNEFFEAITLPVCIILWTYAILCPILILGKICFDIGSNRK